jgi:hypothetical protein
VHAPQLLVSLWVLTHAPLQITAPAGHVQLALTQLAPAGQTRPQAPQLFESLPTLVHIVPQQTVPLRQSPLVPQVHWPLTQLSPAAQTCPQVPQLLGVLRAVSQPSAGLPLQSPKPARQAKPHAPPLQIAVALAGAVQTFPQVPQLLVVFRGVQTPPQHPWPARQVTPQATQLLVVVRSVQTPWQQPRPAAQAWPHEPQLLLSD